MLQVRSMRMAGRRGVRTTSIVVGRVRSRLFQPAEEGDCPGVIVLGGSEGGLSIAAPLAAALAQEGFAALAFPYFGVRGAPMFLDRIRLDHIEDAVAALRMRRGVAVGAVGLYGVSKGAEAALAFASYNPSVQAVVAASPSSVVWQGLNLLIRRSSWTWRGEELPFAPFQRGPWRGLLDLYQRSLASHDADRAVIAVERINGPIALISGGDDRLWPSARMAERIVARSIAMKSRFAVEHVYQNGAGHVVWGPPDQKVGRRLRNVRIFGGSVDAAQAAMARGWPRAVAVLREGLARR